MDLIEGDYTEAVDIVIEANKDLVETVVYVAESV